jgi:hypothetical protein
VRSSRVIDRTSIASIAKQLVDTNNEELQNGKHLVERLVVSVLTGYEPNASAVYATDFEVIE